MPAADVESIERATLAAVPPEACDEVAGWLVPYDRGTVGRAHSAVPLRHEAPEVDVVADIAQRYRERGLKPMLRLPRRSEFASLRQVLEAQGWRTSKPTAVELSDCRTVAELPATAEVSFTAQPTPRWADVFLGEGFDPVDGESRLAILGRAKSSVFATVTIDGQVAAVGSAGYSHGWCGIHGMRTLPAFRGRGLAGSILAALAREALARGIERAFLQVEQGNPARRLYARAGFGEAWVYEYWT